MIIGYSGFQADPILPAWPGEFKWFQSNNDDKIKKEGYDKDHKCVQMKEPSTDGWNDNYLCWSKGSPELTWSYGGELNWTLLP